MLEQFGLLKCIYTLCPLIAVLTEGGVAAVSTGNLGSEESTADHIQYVSWPNDPFLKKHLFIPCSRTSRENFQVFVYLFSWPLRYCIVAYLY